MAVGWSWLWGSGGSRGLAVPLLNEPRHEGPQLQMVHVSTLAGCIDDPC